MDMHGKERKKLAYAAWGLILFVSTASAQTRPSVAELARTIEGPPTLQRARAWDQLRDLLGPHVSQAVRDSVGRELLRIVRSNPRTGPRADVITMLQTAGSRKQADPSPESFKLLRSIYRTSTDPGIIGVTISPWVNSPMLTGPYRS